MRSISITSNSATVGLSDLSSLNNLLRELFLSSTHASYQDFTSLYMQPIFFRFHLKTSALTDNLMIVITIKGSLESEKVSIITTFLQVIY